MVCLVRMISFSHGDVRNKEQRGGGGRRRGLEEILQCPRFLSPLLYSS